MQESIEYDGYFIVYTIEDNLTANVALYEEGDDVSGEIAHASKGGMTSFMRSMGFVMTVRSFYEQAYHLKPLDV